MRRGISVRTKRKPVASPARDVHLGRFRSLVLEFHRSSSFSISTRRCRERSQVIRHDSMSPRRDLLVSALFQCVSNVSSDHKLQAGHLRQGDKIHYRHRQWVPLPLLLRPPRERAAVYLLEFPALGALEPHRILVKIRKEGKRRAVRKRRCFALYGAPPRLVVFQNDLVQQSKSEAVDRFATTQRKLGGKLWGGML